MAIDWRRVARQWWLELLLAVLAIVYVACALSPSSYAVALHIFDIDAQPLLGVAQPIRADEYSVVTPLMQIAVAGHFGPVDVISPYHETLKGFWPAPILDWSLLFKPQLWGFFIAPPAYAYSFYFVVFWLSFILGYRLLFRQLGATPAVATLGTLILLTAHLVQVWWTTHGPCFAFGPWPLVVFLSPIRPLWKAPLICWSTAFWVFGMVYPPFIIAGGFAMLVLLLAFRRDALTVGSIVAAAVGIAAAGAIVVLYFGDLVPTMMRTVYPGMRNEMGGGLEPEKAAALLFPWFSTSQFVPLIAENACEVAVVSTLLPLTVLCFSDYPALLLGLQKNLVAVAIVVAGLVLMAAWMFLPVPAPIGRLLLWNEVEPSRMAWGFGLLLTTALLIVVSRTPLVVSPLRLVAFAGALVAAWLLSKIGETEIWGPIQITAWKALSRSWFDWIGVVPFAIAVTYAARTRVPARRNNALLAAAAVTGLVTFGTFNPVQSTQPIFDLSDNPIVDSLKRDAQSNPNGWATPTGLFGSILTGAGVSTIAHTLPVPQLAFFRPFFPDMPEDQFNTIFNRYAHIVLSDQVDTPELDSQDTILVPIAPFQAPAPK